MFECDAKLSADDLLFLLHDDTLERTTSGQGSARINWAQLNRLDAGSWFGTNFTQEPIPLLESIVRLVLDNHAFLNVEIKPNPGQDYKTGMQCAKFLQRFITLEGICPFLLSSFSEEALQELTMRKLLSLAHYYWINGVIRHGKASVLWNVAALY